MSYIVYRDSSNAEESEEYTEDLDEIRIMKVVDLKKKCKEYNLSTVGRKMELIERLETYISNLKNSKKMEMEVDTSSSSDENGSANEESSSNDSVNEEENSVIIYPQEEGIEQEVEQVQQETEKEKDDENKQPEETNKENGDKMEEEEEDGDAQDDETQEEQQEKTVKHKEKGNGEGGDGDDGNSDDDNNNDRNIDELPVNNDNKEKKEEEEKIVKFELFDMKKSIKERRENVEKEEAEVEKRTKPPVSISNLNDLLQSIVEKAPPKPPVEEPDPEYLPIIIDYNTKKPKTFDQVPPEDLPIILDLSKRVPKPEVVDESLIVKKINARPNENQLKVKSTTESPSSDDNNDNEEKQVNNFKRKCEIITSKLHSQQQQKNEIKKVSNDKANESSSSNSSSSSFDINLSSDEPALKKIKTSSVKENIKSKNIDIKTTATTQPPNLCGNISSFIKKEPNNNNNNNPTNLTKNISTFIKPPTATEDTKRTSLFDHKAFGKKTNFKMFTREKPSTTTEVKKEKVIYPSSYKMNIPLKQEPPPPPKIISVSKTATKTSTTTSSTTPSTTPSTTTTTTAIPIKKESKFISYAKKEVKDIPQPPPPQPSQQPIRKESKYVSYVKKETKDVPPPPQQQQQSQVKKESKYFSYAKKGTKEAITQPVKKEVITEVIDVDESQKLPNDNSSTVADPPITKHTNPANNNNNNSNNNSQLSWADPENLMTTLRLQNTTFDLDSLFGEVTTCDIDEIFPNRHPKPRGSSGNWLNDAVTKEEEEKYKKDTKYSKKK